ncbi:hypothetical protein Metev_0146 [Methanohalobium evestigatum Z-7303]|uniref:Uncharacterized protein n=1 Tax=Methanohalobium evestigatum (strain ATCC BAA-1072 / DSM 3721 / NBRC 107634 / OCM 161 / Z-7303) TaxID=644295 RepID=D7E655_METEZ|nr:hypothetical protein [Methanohalobium evestigatum]ADI73077.1 hypothetical protein Metev_0146 [Methanohalobium evestigatum Z-7303]
MQQCIKCGYKKRGSESNYICEDCQKFSEIFDKLWNEVNYIFNNLEIINPETDKVLKFLSDTAFVTKDNPQTRIYYKISSLIINKAWNREDTINEVEVNKYTNTTKNLLEALKVFEELGIVKIEYSGYERILKIQNKAFKVANAWRSSESLDNQLIERVAQIFAGYVLFYILQLMNNISDVSDLDNLPYNKRQRTLWVTLMSLLSKPYDGDAKINENDISKYLRKRGIASGTDLKIKQSLHNMTENPTGLIKNVKTDDDGYRVYEYSDYVVNEFERIRNGRTRHRVE